MNTQAAAEELKRLDALADEQASDCVEMYLSLSNETPSTLVEEYPPHRTTRRRTSRTSRRA